MLCDFKLKVISTDELRIINFEKKGEIGKRDSGNRYKNIVLRVEMSSEILTGVSK